MGRVANEAEEKAPKQDTPASKEEATERSCYGGALGRKFSISYFSPPPLVPLSPGNAVLRAVKKRFVVRKTPSRRVLLSPPLLPSFHTNRVILLSSPLSLPEPQPLESLNAFRFRSSPLSFFLSVSPSLCAQSACRVHGGTARAMKSAAVFALDVSCSTPAALEKARRVCLQTALDKLLYAPNDELGLVLCGTRECLNPLHSADPSGTRYKHITVTQELAKTGNAFLRSLLAIDPAQPDTGKCDVLETLTVCAHQLHAATGKRKYNRRIYLLTEARDEVTHKQEITTSIKYLQDSGISVVVVGIDFTQDDANVQGSWEGLGTKAENERVLHYLCNTLHETDGCSAVVTLEDTLDGLQELRRRKVLQRGLAKLVLTIGEVKIATQIYSKIVAEKVPSLKKTTSDGSEVGQQIDYVRVGDAGSGGASGQETRIGADGLVKALHYGRSLVPCSDADTEAMKIKGPRGLEGLGFVHQREIPLYIVTGAAKSLLPLAGDASGQRAFEVLVAAMLKRRMGLIVRYVSRTDAKPALGVCMPAIKESSGQSVLYFAPLPFAEDARLYTFSEYTDVVCTPAEEAMMDSLVKDMTVDKHTLQPNATFNPEVHQYYATVREKVLRAAREEVVKRGGDSHHASPATSSTGTSGRVAGGDDVPELILQLQRTSAAFTSKGNALEPLLRRVQPGLESCATAFPYVEIDPEAAGAGGGGGLRRAWYNAAAAAAAMADDGHSTDAPTTVAAPALVRDGPRAGSEAPSSVATVAVTEGLSSGRVDHVSTIDPVGSFRAMVAAAQQDPAARAAAMDGLVNVVFDFLRHSIKDSLYDKCDDCVRELRGHCVADEEPTFFNTFLGKLQATAQELELGDAYWTAHIVKGTGTHPITRTECKSSAIADEKAAREFMTRDRALPPVDLDEDMEEDLLDLLI